MADKKLAAVGSILFLALVAMLLLILYFPETTESDDEAGLWTPEVNVRLGSSFEHTDAPEPVSKMAAAARQLENMGAGFLALLAVICVASGLFCLTCACCVVS